jgi:hypothetical protein
MINTIAVVQHHEAGSLGIDELGRRPAAGTGCSHGQPLVQALQVVPVHAGHHSQGVTHLELLQAHSALLPPVEPVVVVPPVHRRDAADLLGRQTVRPLGFREEGRVVGVSAELVLHVVRVAVTVQWLEMCLLLLVVEHKLDFLLHGAGVLLLAVAVVDLASL